MLHFPRECANSGMQRERIIESSGDLRILGRQIIYGIAGHLLPAANPKAAEPAIAVVNHERFWRRGGNFDTALHGLTLNQPQHERQCGSILKP